MVKVLYVLTKSGIGGAQTGLVEIRSIRQAFASGKPIEFSLPGKNTYE